MRYLTILLLLGVTLKVNAQQINPVPDYVFRYQMSVGRNAATDSLAYFSIGPKYGANKGFMPPMVVDTATVTGAAKRNGLTIFSIQRNKYLYWDSVRVQWSDFAGSSGAYIFASDTTAMLAPYVRIAGIGLTKGTQTLSVDTNTISTRAWRQKGIDSLAALELSLADTATMLSPYVRAAGFGLTKSGQSLLADSATMATRARVQKGIDSVAGLSRVTGSGTTNTIPKWTSSTALGNSGVTDQSTVNILQLTSSNTMWYKGASTTANAEAAIENDNTAFYLYPSLSGAVSKELRFYFNGSSSGERIRIFNNGRVFIGPNPVDVPSHQLQVAGSIYNTTSAVFAASSGGVSIGTTSQVGKLNVVGSGAMTTFNTGIATDARLEYLYNGNRRSLFNFDTLAVGFQQTSGVNFYITGTNSNVGIGTTSPSERLHVNGRARIATIDSSASPINMLWADVNGVVRKTAPAVQGSGTTNYVAKFTGSTAVGNSLIFDNGTSVGIGTTSPASTFTVQTAGESRATFIGGAASGTGINFGDASVTDIGRVEYNNNGDYMALWTNSGERLRITSGGDVGIGNTSPSERLHVTGRARVTTIDSSGSPINMLWADNSGVIRKAAVPAGGGGSADSALFATRARVQKAVDSINNVNASGTGISGYLNKWTGAKTMDTSQIFQFADRIGIGTTTADSRLDVRYSPTFSTSLNNNINSEIAYTVGSATTFSSGSVHSGLLSVNAATFGGSSTLDASSIMSGALAINRLAFSAGSSTTTVNQGSGVKALAGLFAQLQTFGSTNGTISHGAGISVQGIFKRETSNLTFTNYYGVLVGASDEFSGTTITNKWGIYQNGANDNNYFAGKMLVNTTTATGSHRLIVNGTALTTSLTTDAPAGGTAGTWKLGTRVASSVTLDGTQYIEVDIGGTLYYLATVSFLEPKPSPKPNP
jgi:hypothetical protein